MTKYYISLEADGNFHIIEYDTGEGVRVLRDAGGRETSIVIYHSRVVIPESVNYPELVIRNIFVPFSAVRAEVWPGEPGWGK